MVLAAALAVSIPMIYAQSAHPPMLDEVAGSGAAPASAAVVQTPGVARPSADLLAASAPPDAKVYDLPLTAGVAPESGLQVRTIWVARAISTMFPDITTIGGYRQDPLPWHPNGLAIDVMIPDHGSEAGIELGNQIAGLALANAQRWGVIHVIWRQGFYPGIGAPTWTADYGNETANHYDHVHIATSGGGFPTGQETYFSGYMTPAPPN
jgi:hypothetical protein